MSKRKGKTKTTKAEPQTKDANEHGTALLSDILPPAGAPNVLLDGDAVSHVRTRDGRRTVMQVAN